MMEAVKQHTNKKRSPFRAIRLESHDSPIPMTLSWLSWDTVDQLAGPPWLRKFRASWLYPTEGTSDSWLR